MFQIKNSALSVRVDSVGAQLTGLYSPATDMEYLWQPGYETWPHSSMLLFPNPGRIAQDRVIIGGKIYPATMHGFANDMPFDCIEHSENKLVLELKDSAATRKYFPYAFRLQVEFILQEDMLIQNFRVINDDTQPVYYCLGAHPGFYCPLVLGENASDYTLTFDRPQNLEQLDLEENTRLLTGNKTAYLQGATTIPLHDHFFDNGPMLFEGMDAASITLRSGASGHFVEMGIQGFPHLCLWGVPTRMSLIAIEPWIGTSDRVDTDHIWEHKPGIQSVAPGEINTHTLTFRVG